MWSEVQIQFLVVLEFLTVEVENAGFSDTLREISLLEFNALTIGFVSASNTLSALTSSPYIICHSSLTWFDILIPRLWL
jgi:hypothetical protein